MINNYHYHFGIHSNVPECCAQYYNDKMNQGFHDIGITFRPEYTDNYWDIAYVVCDACDILVKNNAYTANRIHKCDEHKTDCKWFLTYNENNNDYHRL